MIDTFIVFFRFPEREHPAGSFRLPSPGVMLSHLRNTEELPPECKPQRPRSLQSLVSVDTQIGEGAALTPSLVSNSLETCNSHLILW